MRDRERERTIESRRGTSKRGDTVEVSQGQSGEETGTWQHILMTAYEAVTRDRMEA